MEHEIPENDLEQLHTFCGQSRFDEYGAENEIPADVLKNYHRYRHILQRGTFSPLTPDALATIVFLSSLQVGQKVPSTGIPTSGQPVLCKWRGKEVEARFLAPTADPDEWIVDMAGEERRLPKKLIREKVA